MPRLIYGGKQKRSPLYWDGDVLGWIDESSKRLRSAHIRPDGRVEIREYYAPREFTAESVERDVFAALNHGSDARWEHRILSGEKPWPEEWIAERDGDGHVRRLEYCDHNRRNVCVGVVVEKGVWTIAAEEMGWSQPFIGGEQVTWYSHPYRGEVK